MKAVILTYHSHHVLGTEYGNNDHVALPRDLALISSMNHRIVPLNSIVSAVEEQKLGQQADDDELWVGLTFDDGPAFDVDDFTHPQFGLQRSFLHIMREFAETPGGRKQTDLNATSFVIASPHARQIMETTFDAEYTFLGPGSMGDDWWHRAIATGFISIANHSWDHLHPALPEVAHSKQARADFRQVATWEDADRQILAAAIYIAEKTAGKSMPFFAYPFGHYNEFLTNEYMPNARLKGKPAVRAAFTADPRAIAGGESVWCLPRYICGHHWKNPGELLAILGDNN